MNDMVASEPMFEIDAVVELRTAAGIVQYTCRARMNAWSCKGQAIYHSEKLLQFMLGELRPK